MVGSVYDMVSQMIRATTGSRVWSGHLVSWVAPQAARIVRTTKAVRFCSGCTWCDRLARDGTVEGLFPSCWDGNPVHVAPTGRLLLCQLSECEAHLLLVGQVVDHCCGGAVRKAQNDMLGGEGVAVTGRGSVLQELKPLHFIQYFMNRPVTIKEVYAIVLHADVASERPFGSRPHGLGIEALPISACTCSPLRRSIRQRIVCDPWICVILILVRAIVPDEGSAPFCLSHGLETVIHIAGRTKGFIADCQQSLVQPVYVISCILGVGDGGRGLGLRLGR